MDDVFVSGAGSHAVETWNIDGLNVGTVTARKVGESALLIQTTTNAQIGLVDGENVATGTRYAVFRMANRAGRVGSSYPTNIRVGEVVRQADFSPAALGLPLAPCMRRICVGWRLGAAGTRACYPGTPRLRL